MALDGKKIVDTKTSVDTKEAFEDDVRGSKNGKKVKRVLYLTAGFLGCNESDDDNNYDGGHL